MSNNLADDKAHNEHGSATDQVCKEFEKLSVCAVSSILSTDSKPRKIFRSVVFLLFTVVFLYQCIAFLCYVLQYPTVVDSGESSDLTFVLPALTFCNYNPIKRSKFCAKYPGNCTRPNRQVCEKHPRFCGTLDTLILKDDFNIDSLDELFLLRHEAADMVVSGMNEEDTPLEPLPRVNPPEMETLMGACFTFNDRVSSPLDPIWKDKTPTGNGMLEYYRFNPEENEIIYPESQAGIMFQVHSPFEGVNPFRNGFLMKPGYLYRITVKITQEELSSDCLNYTEVWLKNNRTGYRSKAACQHKCVGDIIVQCENCTLPLMLYPYPDLQFCREPNITEKCSQPEEDFSKCLDKCQDDCVKLEYSYEVQESYPTRYNRLVGTNESREIFVFIQFPGTDMQKIIHKPEFQILEIFSLIGGLLAFWIGLSMFQVVEVFDCMFQAIKRLATKNSKGSVGSTA